MIRATNTIFPEGKGSSVKTSSKDVFQVDPEVTEIEEEDDLQAVMDMVAEEVQGREDWEEEDVLETFETYTDIQKETPRKQEWKGILSETQPRKRRREVECIQLMADLRNTSGQDRSVEGQNQVPSMQAAWDTGRRNAL